MDKVIINNQIVLMRKFVKQAKIHAINNYTKEIRKLQNRKGNDDETSKHKRKAERLISKIAILRKIQPDSISRKALAKEKDWKDVLKKKDISLEDQCYAMLANYGPVQSEVEKFHKKHWDLVPKITTLFESWEEKSKNPMMKQEKKKAKELRKSMKAANVKLGKDNPNAAPIGQKNKDDPIRNISQTKPPLNNQEKEKNYDVLNEAPDDLKEELDSKHIQNNTTPMPFRNTGTDEEATDGKNEEMEESKNTLKKSLKKEFLQKKVTENKIDLNETADKEELEENLLKQLSNGDFEENGLECESEPNSPENDSDSEDNDTAEDESIEECPGSAIESETEEILEDTKESNKASMVAMKQKPNLKAPKSVSIETKLKAIAGLSQKTNKYEKRKSNFKAKVDSAKKPEENHLKAVTMLNLNELEGLDEIPIEKNNNITQETGEKKRKKDPFFLGKGGEVVSESDNEDSINLGQEKDGLEFKRRKFNNIDRKSSDGEFFKKRSFHGDAPQNRKSGFKESGFQRNSRNSNFEHKGNSFQKRERPSFEFHKDKGFKSMPKDQFINKRETKSFGDRPSGRKQNFPQEPSNKEHFQKKKLSSPLKKSISDDKPLHPSWEAKKKLKESANAKFQGKRIVFGD